MTFDFGEPFLRNTQFGNNFILKLLAVCEITFVVFSVFLLKFDSFSDLISDRHVATRVVCHIAWHLDHLGVEVLVCWNSLAISRN